MMGWMCRGLVSCWVWWSLLSMVSAEEQIQLGGPEDCKNAEFVPGHNLGGEGIDIVKMERKGSYIIEMEKWDIGNGSCRMSRNSYMNKAKQKMPAAVVFWRTIPECSMKVSSQIYESSEALVKDSTSSVSNNWKKGLNVIMKGSVSVGGTHSREAQFSMKKSKEDKFSFTKHVVECSFYRYKIASSPPLHQEFLQAVKSLPRQYNPHSYQSIIDTFGTHYTTGVKLGGKMKAVTAIRACQAGLDGLKGTAVKDCLDVEASGTYKSATMTAEMRHCQALKKKMHRNEKFSSMFSERQTEIVGGNVNGEDLLFSRASHPNALKGWLDSLKTIPDVVTYSLKPLHLVLNTSHPARQGLKKAVESYIRDNALKKVCSRSCKLGRQGNPRDRCACVCENYLNIGSNCCPSKRSIATLKVFNLRAQGLHGDIFSKTDGYVEITYDRQFRRTEVINNNDNPRWRNPPEFGTVKMFKGGRLNFKVFDEDIFWMRELLGQCSFDLRSGTVTKTCFFTHGTFIFSYTVQCAPRLRGRKCDHYKPSPMETSQSKIFSSRNGILAKDMWKLQAAQNDSSNLYIEGHYRNNRFSSHDTL